MYKLILITIACLGVISARSTNNGNSVNQINEDGSYQYLYKTPNGIFVQESGVGAVIAQGAVQWSDPNGENVHFTYTADHNGYQVSGSHIPQPPPIPSYILRALEYQKQHPWKEELIF